jgi:hypothetical protein
MSELKSCDMILLGSFQKQISAHGRFAGIAPFDEQLRLPVTPVPLAKSVEFPNGNSKGTDRGRERSEGRGGGLRGSVTDYLYLLLLVC